MKRVILTFIATLICNNAYSIDKINASQSAFHIGENVIACGVVKQISQFKKGVYLNLNAAYPNQPLTLVVWDDHIAAVEKEMGALDAMYNKSICVSGLITKYKGRSQMKIYNGFSIKKVK
ncbi:hypothetical protein D5018_06850 [Parashewanella curva]|uniref:DNA-binding protein n=1 Tax=Parashewanella curva TaxID=2338552 RepID=A0A3L8PYY7_9GAMM|nr:hypothetical protein [Parashewanella curva]RLV60505.1 hypothetical protein D5018_06850 [Parashewanella curva]